MVTLATYVVWPTLESKYAWKDSAKIVRLLGALGLGAFAVLGAQKAAEMDGLDPLIWIVSGLMSATFGGVARDVILLEPPRSLHPQCATCAAHPLLGSAVCTALVSKFYMQKDKAAIISFVLISTTRILSFNNPLRLPRWSQSQRSRTSLKRESILLDAESKQSTKLAS